MNLTVLLDAKSVFQAITDEFEVILETVMLEIIGYVASVVKFASTLSLQPPLDEQDFTV